MPGAVVAQVTTAYLSQVAIQLSSQQLELLGHQNTVIATYNLLVPATVAITAASQVVDEDAIRYQVVGQPADRRGLGRRVLFRAAALSRISDLQS